MQDILLKAHSGWPYIVGLVGIAALVKLLIGLVGNGRWSKLDQQLGAALPIVLDVQLLLGIILWIVEQRWNGAIPLASWEHPVTMILVVAAAHITWTQVKKIDLDATKYRTAVIGYAITGILLTVGVLRITRMM
jgi:hypothetical protein